VNLNPHHSRLTPRLAGLFELVGDPGKKNGARPLPINLCGLGF